MTNKVRFFILALMVLTVNSITYLANKSKAQQVTIGIKPGQIHIVATYVNTNGKLVSDTLDINIGPIPVATVELYNSVNPAKWVNNATVGQSLCIYAQARDSSGNILTGRKVTLSVSDTSLASIKPSETCPDTTVDMSLYNKPVSPPMYKLNYRSHD